MEFSDHSSDRAGDETSVIVHAVEPPSALLVGGTLGGTTFLLCALLFGARAALLIAALGALVSLVRRVPAAAAAFAISAAVAGLAIAIASSTTALIVSSASFGIALAIFARARMRARVAAGMGASRHGFTMAAH
jgi:hypothetical protein